MGVAGPGVSPIHWHAPKDPRQTPWLGASGWLALTRCQVGLLGKRVLAQASAIDKLIDRPGEDIGDVAALRGSCQAQVRAAASVGVISPELVQRCVHLLALLAQRSLGLRPSVPQLMAAIAMTQGNLVQLAPGEGKTLSVAMTAVWFAWSARPCHVVTANDYLAGRDAQLMRPFYHVCGVSVDAITDATPHQQLGNCYRADVVYATAKQFLADFLRDDLLLQGARDPVRRRLWHMRANATGQQPVMRGLHAAIIDEADGVLIDEATTPLIIAQPEEDKSQMLLAIARARDLVEELKLERDYSLHMQAGSVVHFTPEGKSRIESLAQEFGDYWQTPLRREEIFNLAIMARDVFQRDRHFIIRDGAVVIVDENTGRSMPGRSWSHGIHQSIEAREGIALTKLTRISARMTFQEFFRHYHRLCGASGTLHGLGFELWSTFGVCTLRLPPRTPSRLAILPRRHFLGRAEKLKGFVERVVELNQSRCPVLVGTRRILDSEQIALALQERGIACAVLNAKEHAREAEIVARAGELDRVTVATNMAGRGTDIVLAPGVEALGGLSVLMFESHESPRIDWQLFGRAGRHGSRGSAQAFASFEEELILRYLPVWAKPLRWIKARAGMDHWRLELLLWLSQLHAQRIAAAQRRYLAMVQKQLREQLGFTRA